MLYINTVYTHEIIFWNYIVSIFEIETQGIKYTKYIAWFSYRPLTVNWPNILSFVMRPSTICIQFNSKWSIYRSVQYQAWPKGSFPSTLIGDVIRWCFGVYCLEMVSVSQCHQDCCAQLLCSQRDIQNQTTSLPSCPGTLTNYQAWCQCGWSCGRSRRQDLTDHDPNLNLSKTMLIPRWMANISYWTDLTTRNCRNSLE